MLETDHTPTAKTTPRWVSYVATVAITILWIAAGVLCILSDLVNLGVGASAVLATGAAATVTALWFLGLVRAETRQKQIAAAEQTRQLADTLDAVAGQITHLTATHRRAEAGRQRIVEDLTAIRGELAEAVGQARWQGYSACLDDIRSAQGEGDNVLILPATRRPGA